MKKSKYQRQTGWVNLPIISTILQVFFCSILAFFLPRFSLAQPAEITWLKKNASQRNMHTACLLQADSAGFFLLREKHEPGKTPVPYLAVLDATGDLLRELPLPGFETTTNTFYRFVIKGKGVILVGYEKQNSNGQYQFCLRPFDIFAQNWTHEAIEIFPSVKSKLASPTGFRISTNGDRIAVFRFNPGAAEPAISAALLDAQFNLLWSQQYIIPKQDGATILQDVFCTDNGNLIVYAKQYSAGAKMVVHRYPPITSSYWPDGNPVLQLAEDTDENSPAWSNVLFCINGKTTSMNAFFPGTISRYTHSLKIGEDAQHRVICAGLGSDKGPNLADKYFIYTINTETNRGEIVKSGAIPANFKKVFISDHAVEQKKPIADIALRWVKTTPDGQIWLLAEQEQQDFIGNAALLKLDSAYRISNVTPIVKSMRVKAGDQRCFVSVAPCLSDKGSWWLLWHENNWPEMQLMLTPAKAKESFMVNNSLRTEFAMLINTLTQWGHNRYFVGESEDCRWFKIGFISKIDKKNKND